MADVFEGIYGQPRVREFLRAIVAVHRVSHAYLFTGPAGSNKTAAAYALAQAILCEQAEGETSSACSCENCRMVRRRTHPDVHYLAPEGAQGYLVEQIRGIVADANLAPIKASRKVYILDRVDLLGTSAANAFLKTLEEPPDDAVFILLGRTRDSVLSTIVSRCQVVPFRHIPASEAAAILVQNTGCTQPEAAIAIQTCGGSVTKAAEYLRTPERRRFRQEVVAALASLARADDLDVLTYAKTVTAASKSPLDVVRREQEAAIEEQAEFLQKSAVKQLETRNKRALSQASFELLSQMCATARGWLRDVAAVCAGTPELVINADAMQTIQDAASMTDLSRVCKALTCVDAAQRAISYNVSPQVSIESMLFEIREVLYA